LIQYEDIKKEICELKKAPRILQKRTSRMMIRNYQFGVRGSYVSEFKIEYHDLMQLGKQMDGAHIFLSR
jgi:hypothetical protein